MSLLVIILLLSPLVHQELAEIWSDGLILFEEHAIVAIEILFLSSLEFILHLNKLRVRDEGSTIYKIEKVFLLIQLLGSSIFVTKALISELLNFFLHFVRRCMPTSSCTENLHHFAPQNVYKMPESDYFV